MAQPLSHLRPPEPALIEQRCPVCGKVLFETTPDAQGVIKIHCRACQRRRFIRIEREES
jgi:phage FluMu protein Com